MSREGFVSFRNFFHNVLILTLVAIVVPVFEREARVKYFVTFDDIGEL